ncbi:YfhO family protein, partial [Candidatus Desantisbacteria bacterium]|nr:YfhO family protein [Candidatus Desantisbacteria bacterium]
IIGVFAFFGWLFKDAIIDVFSQTIKWDNWALFRYSTYRDKYEYFYESVLSFLVIFGGIIIWTALKNLKEAPEKLLKIVCVIIFIIDVGSINDKFFSTVPLDKLVSYDPVTVPQGMKHIMDKGENHYLYRVFPNVQLDEKYARANSWSLYFQIIGGYTGVKHKLYSDFMQYVTFDNRMIDILNVKYIALDRQAIPYSNIQIGAQVGRYIVDYIDNSIIILLNPLKRDSVHLIFNYMVLPAEDILPVLKSSNIDPLSTIILEENPDIKISPEINTNKNARLISKKMEPGFYDFEVEMPKPGFVVFSDTYYPGWKAYIDGKETKIYKTDYLVRSIFVPTGKHHIISKFRPLPFILGVWISGLTILGLIIIFILKKMKKIDI